MSKFRLQSNFSPTGDQPQAIQELTKGLSQGHRDQVLLGVTGSGKSLDGREPILLYRETKDGMLATQCQIGPFVDKILGPVTQSSQEGKEGLLGYFVPSFDPISQKTRLSPIASVSRHLPDSLYRLQTECGRETILTGDHNVYIRRNNQMVLVETAEINPGDEIPLPSRLLGPKSDLVSQNTPEGEIQLSDNALRLMGAYLQAGGARDTKSFILLLRDDEVETLITKTLQKLKLPTRTKSFSALEVLSPLWSQFLQNSFGTSPKDKRLPSWWPMLSDRQLGLFLSSFFDRAGVTRLEKKCLEYSLPVSGLPLAHDLAFALLRLGIFCQICQEESFVKVSIQKPQDIDTFSQKVGFRTVRRREVLSVLCHQIETTSLSKEESLRFTKARFIEKIPVNQGTPYVYDLSVPGDETFFGGRGGLFFHNTFTIANVIQEVQKPTLIIAHNKTLAAQLYGEFHELFPDNAVHYFVSYYDYYQPEAYVPTSDTYIEKDAQVNEEIDRMRHAATSALLARQDVIIIASVSCIYGLGDPKSYAASRLFLEINSTRERDKVLRKLVDIQYERNDIDFYRGVFRVRGEVVEIFPSSEEDRALRIEFFGDDIEALSWIDPLRGKVLEKIERATIHPASHYVIPESELKGALHTIRQELQERLVFLRKNGKLLEAQRLEERTTYDLEMLEQLGYCNGVENYSRHFTGAAPGDPPPTLLDYFPENFLAVLDESHATIPQLGAMYKGDRSRKTTLVEFGFRLPSALDNRPLQFQEFEEKTYQRIFVSATPGPYELGLTQGVIIEQIIRPTGLLDPMLEIRPAGNQVDDLLEEIRKRIAVKERVLVTTLTKRMAEDLTEYYTEVGLRVRYMHADVQTLERSAILRALRKGEFDVLVGINLLREGLDLPEVSLVAILDADKEGFLRSERSLIQTFGRAARNVNGTVILYADKITASMQKAMDETDRRRKIQDVHNIKHKITPTTVIRPITELEPGDPQSDYALVPEIHFEEHGKEGAKTEDLDSLLARMEKEMHKAAKDLDFEKAAELRDKIRALQAVALGLRKGAGVAATAENPAWVNPWVHKKKKKSKGRGPFKGKRR